MSVLLDRCRDFLSESSPEEAALDLRDFVLSEIGRAADETRLGDASALVLYFSSDEDREFLVEAFKQERPDAIERKWP